jgi:hypothetical protein
MRRPVLPAALCRPEGHLVRPAGNSCLDGTATTFTLVGGFVW